MTELRKRRLGEPLRTFATDLADAIERARVQSTAWRWPNPQWRDSPADFAYWILGIRCWLAQANLLNLVATNQYTVCKGGRRLGKSVSAAILTLWRLCSFDRAQVLITSSTSQQLEGAIWSEVRKLLARSGLCADCFDSDPRQPRPCPHSHVIDDLDCMTTSKGGIRSLDPLFPRFAVGKTASKAVSIQSFGSADCLVICDEAPGVADVVHDSLIGTLAGGGCAVWLGNANRNRGFFHDAFSDEQFAKLTISSLESPNYIAGRTVVPGLAERGWVDSQIKRHGIESYFVRTNILGLFTDGVDESKPFSIDRIAESQIRWSTTPAEGRLFLGVDPSGTGADLTAISLLRGRKHMHMEASAALHGDLIVQRIISLLLRYRQPGEVPVVVIDAEGVGAPISKQLRAHAMRDPSSMKIVSVISSTKTPRYSTDPYDRTRDALIGSLERWMRDGGAIITDPQLEEELNFLEWSEAEIGGKLKITSKTKIKSELSRSPDKLDSLALACWVPRWLSSERAEPRKGSTPRNQAARQPQQQRGRAQINPYAGRR